MSTRPSRQSAGLFDHLLRTYRGITLGLTMIPIYMVAAIIMGTAAAPGVAVYRVISGLGADAAFAWQCLAAGIGVAAGFFTYGFSLLLILPIMNYPLLRLIKPARDTYHSGKFTAWYLHNSLSYLVRYTFLDFAVPTAFGNSYFRRMGMKIGKNVMINTSNISDAALLTIEDNVTIGGSVTLLAHYGVGGYLILSPTVIRKGATIGLLATIMADVEIGENARILPNSVVLPKTRVPAGETWGGVPARKIET